MNAEFIDFSCFIRKAGNAPNCLFYNLKRRSGHTKPHVKNNKKSIEHLCNKKKHAKHMENYPNAEPTWTPESSQNRKSINKTESNNRHGKDEAARGLGPP